MTPDSRDTTAVARIEYTGGVALFTSAQERRLWRWALLVLAAIYATLGLAGTLNELVRNERLIGNSMVVAFFLLIVFVFQEPQVALLQKNETAQKWPSVWSVPGMELPSGYDDRVPTSFRRRFSGHVVQARPAARGQRGVDGGGGARAGSAALCGGTGLLASAGSLLAALGVSDREP